jgi:dihydrofolate reductase
MAKVTTELSMSLDGYIAHTDDRVDDIFDWFDSGDVEITTATPELTFHVSEASARHIRENFPLVGAHLVGRRLFDITNGWNGRHTIEAPVVVVTHRGAPQDWVAEHPDAPFTFVDDIETGVEKAKAIARAADGAGDKRVSVAGPNVVQQVINLGLMDEITVSLVPVLIGEGIPFFGKLVQPPVKLDGPRVIEGEGVTHLSYRVVKS